MEKEKARMKRYLDRKREAGYKRVSCWLPNDVAAEAKLKSHVAEICAEWEANKAKSDD